MNVTIIGAGIAGLTTALALKKMGIPCRVFERAGALNEVGAGIWIQPNALKVLDWLDLGNPVRKAGTLLDQVDITNAQLVPFKKMAKDVVRDKKGNRIVAIHRATLQKMLFDALPEGTVLLDSPFHAYTHENDRLLVSAGNQEVATDLLIGADGIHSLVRNETFSGTSLRYSGQSCWRGVSDIHLPEGFQGAGIESWGKGIRFGFSQIAADKVYWFAVKKAPQHEKDDPGTLKTKLDKLYRDFHPLVRKIIAQTPSDKMIRNDLSDLKRLPSWHSNNIVLVGDAAHATTPNMGQGAGQGMEDAYYLAHFLVKNQEIPSSLAQFETARRAKVDYIVNNSWRFGQMAHSTLGQALMKTMMKLTPARVMTRQMENLYHIDSL